MEEIWKDVKGYKGYYQVSNFGNVKSVDRLIKQRCGKNNKIIEFKYKGRQLKPRIINSGYAAVDLCKNHKSKRCLIHRLVAEAFLTRNAIHSQINHKDENKLNNVVTNLEWCTPSYNSTYNCKNKKVAIKNSKIIIQSSLDGEVINKYIGSNNASNATKIPARGIRKSCCNHKPYKGFIWKYETF